ncbi:CG18268 [Drosophila busckii]|uniref:CG18268 n=1 Tax=Drosophila busckii TaxID=30019 RepID=A0A0M4ET18_DROBS|nr:uncharacterized protein LOC108602266 [Drosophila busckii]ALC47985.1 CG18268 [Drosophila busckii]
MRIKCHFNLSRLPAVYYTGEQISGTLALTVKKKPIALKGITISLCGTSNVSWHEPAAHAVLQVEHNDSTLAQAEPPAGIDYTAQKVHIEQFQKLSGALILQPGWTDLGNFEFTLPNKLPGSCSLPLGSISYALLVKLERVSKPEKIYQQKLCIRKHIEFFELNAGHCESAALRLSLHRSVFVPGQRIIYRLQAKEPARIFQSQTRLCQCISYASQQPVAKINQVVRVLIASTEPTDALRLPRLAPLMSQQLEEPIQISYYLETLSNCSDPLKIPLYVGSVAPLVVDQQLACTDFTRAGCYVNLGLTEIEPMFYSMRQLLPINNYSQETNALGLPQKLKLLQLQKKQSYVHLAIRHFYKSLFP